jgi:CheY-like chemotaxis protein
MTILYADDDFDDRSFLLEAFKEISPSISCITACDGVQIFDILNKAAVLPDVIFLDINMPVMDGKECLMELKKHNRFSKIPVIIYSTAADPEEINVYYRLGATSFIRKPHSFELLHTELHKFYNSFTQQQQNS